MLVILWFYDQKQFWVLVKLTCELTHRCLLVVTFLFSCYFSSIFASPTDLPLFTALVNGRPYKIILGDQILFVVEIPILKALLILVFVDRLGCYRWSTCICIENSFRGNRGHISLRKHSSQPWSIQFFFLWRQFDTNVHVTFTNLVQGCEKEG